MDACGCDDFASVFDRRMAQRDRDRYHRAGADRTTRLLLDMIRAYGVAGSTILDIGGGIGVIDQELLKAGGGHAVLVEASRAYLDVAREEARRMNAEDQYEFVDGDFVRRAADCDPADIVTLHRVVCCYPDAEGLVGLSAARARIVYGLVLPRNRWIVRAALGLLNFRFWLRRKAYRAYAHPNERIDELVATRGLRPRSEVTTMMWRVVVYDRTASDSVAGLPKPSDIVATPG